MILCEDIKFVILIEFVVGSKDRKIIVRSVKLNLSKSASVGL